MVDTKHEKILTMWNEGKSFSQIAAEFGVSRGAISGIVHRARQKGLAFYRFGPTRNTQFIVEKKRREKIEVVEPAMVTAPDPYNLSVAELKANSCRYPTAVSPKNEWLFCGHAKTRGAYCEHHANLCYHDRPLRQNSSGSRAFGS